MAINITDENFYQYLEDGGEAIENRSQVPVMAEDEIDYTVSFPAVKYDKDPSTNSTAKPIDWRQVYWKTFWNKILVGYNMCEDATADLAAIKVVVQDAADAANAAATLANTAATGASNVNATLVGMTVTITDRQGQSRSTNIGFEIYRTYGSVALMNADAANVLEGKFVMIATSDPTSAENARLYCRNSNAPTSQEPFTFLSDLDQASAEAWADWLNNMKPQIEAATAAANAAAGRVDTVIATANSDHTRAESDHTRAESDHSTVVTATNNANIQANRAKLWADHPPYIADGTQQHQGDLNYWYIWSESLNQYVKSPYAKGDDLHWEEMSEQEKEDLAQRVLSELVFASIQTCEDIIDELT